MKRLFGLVLIVWLVGGLLAGATSALTIYKTEFEYSDFGWQNYTKLYQLENGSIVPALYRGDEASLPSYLDATLFCPLDSINPDNTTTCYVNGAEQSATVYFNESTGYPKLTSGVVGNAFEFGGATNEYVRITTDFSTLTALTVAFYLKADSVTATDRIWNYGPDYLSMSVVSGPRLQTYVYTSAGLKMLYLGYIELNKTYFVVVTYRFASNSTTVTTKAYEVDTGALAIDSTLTTDPANLPASKPLDIGGSHYTYNLDGMLDEFRMYFNKTLTDDEVQILLHINRYKFATLSAPSATFDGSQFLVNVTATLPADGGSYLLPAPINAISSYSSAGQIGNFTFLQVGSSSEASFQIPAKPGQAVPGLSMLGIETDEGFYAYGSRSMNLTNPLSRPLYGSPAPLNHITAGKVTAVDWSGVSTLTLFRPSGYISLAGGDGTLKFLKHSQEYFKMDVTVINPIKLNFENLAPLVEYNVLLNTEEKASFTADDYGQATYTLSSTGTWEIGLPNSIYESFSSNILAIVTTVLIVAVFVGFVVEQTPQKWDDNAAKALFTILAIAMILAIVKLILYLL